MNEVKCELCGKNGEEWVLFGHSFCKECADKFKEYIQITVDIAEKERRADKRIEVDDVGEFCKIKEGKKDIIRVSREYEQGDVVSIYYHGYAYKDEVQCKVIGCHKSASGGYILELINL